MKKLIGLVSICLLLVGCGSKERNIKFGHFIVDARLMYHLDGTCSIYLPELNKSTTISEDTCKRKAKEVEEAEEAEKLRMIIREELIKFYPPKVKDNNVIFRDNYYISKCLDLNRVEIPC